jgi:hypothetical protein
LEVAQTRRLQGDGVTVTTTTNASQPQKFPTFQRYMDECIASGEVLDVPRGCYTEKRTGERHVEFLVDEERYQEFQRRKAEVKAADEKTAEASQADEELTARDDREEVPDRRSEKGHHELLKGRRSVARC